MKCEKQAGARLRWAFKIMISGMGFIATEMRTPLWSFKQNKQNAYALKRPLWHIV